MNRATRLLRDLDKDLPALVAAAKVKALEGDAQCLRLLLERVLPARKPSAAPIELPALASAQTLTEKADAVLQAIGDGSLPPDQGSQLLTAMGQMARIVEIDELERRVAALEVTKV